MIDLTYLSKLLALMEKKSVTKIKMAGLEMEFHVEQQPVAPTASVSSPAIPALETNIPPDLRSDTLMNMDKVLNWSAPSDVTDKDETLLPLIEETAL